ncbi:hypothetical protein GCM10010389_50240 [Streptomyces echinoruber]|uniref:Uncharacterized protein n=1 Tax=Streptomyces echinoruber TaxID=68898 RepID=A0A918RM92_9ACTN|nr:hypothetical protein GCM10010389_50240 [Streptomyces echinoruber]
MHRAYRAGTRAPYRIRHRNNAPQERAAGRRARGAGHGPPAAGCGADTAARRPVRRDGGGTAGWQAKGLRPPAGDQRA